jgi:hypothetical protein
VSREDFLEIHVFIVAKPTGGLHGRPILADVWDRFGRSIAESMTDLLESVNGSLVSQIGRPEFGLNRPESSQMAGGSVLIVPVGESYDGGILSTGYGSLERTRQPDGRTYGLRGDETEAMFPEMIESRPRDGA